MDLLFRARFGRLRNQSKLQPVSTFHLLLHSLASLHLAVYTHIVYTAIIIIIIINMKKIAATALVFLSAPSVWGFATRSSLSTSSTALFGKPKVFIDGEAGTTGIQVYDRLSKRDDLEIISAPPELRKDVETRKKLINEADAVILCKCF